MPLSRAKNKGHAPIIPAARGYIRNRRAERMDIIWRAIDIYLTDDLMLQKTHAQQLKVEIKFIAPHPLSASTPTIKEYPSMKCAIKFAVLALIGAASSTMVRWWYIHTTTCAQLYVVLSSNISCSSHIV